MARYVKYDLEDGSSIMIEVDEPKDAYERTAGGKKEDVVPAGQKFEKAWADIRSSVKVLLNELDMLQISEADIKFGIKSLGETGLNGVFVIGKVSGEVNYEVTLKWKKAGN